MVEAILRTEALTKTFGSATALAELTCSIHAGEVVGLLGPNGAGKTTTMKLLVGMLRPTRGRAEVLGLDSTRDALEIKRRVGYTPDEPSFYDFLSGRETIDFATNVRGGDRDAVWTRLSPLVEALEFETELDRHTGTYSHGTKKKLALLVALAHAPRLLLLDEPTNGLDPPAAAKVRAAIRSIALAGAAVVVSTHLLESADRLCDRVLLLHRGRLLLDGTPALVRARAGLDSGASLEDAFLALTGHE
jgi:ABC-2 type transport system ATP-binding protein